MAKRKHRNKVSRLTAKERVNAYFAWLDNSDTTWNTTEDRAYVLRMLEAHARATLDRAKRRSSRG
jgi:hypothetical protein